MYTVDLSKLKAGDTVHFQCGGFLVVEEQNFYLYDQTVEIKFKGYDTYVSFYLNGKQSPYGGFPFDIIRVEPAFRWEDVRPGMGFMHETRGLCWYVGPSYSKPEELVVVGTARGGGDYQSTFKEYLTPAPEHNIEVAK